MYLIKILAFKSRFPEPEEDKCTFMKTLLSEEILFWENYCVKKVISEISYCNMWIFKHLESSRSNAGSDVDDVDDLFDGVSRIDDEVMNSPIMSDISNKGRSTLTRQKSRLEIKTELIVVSSHLSRT